MPRQLVSSLPGAPPATNGGAAAHGGGNAKFPIGMVIILAVFICAVIFALGLNPIIRCALRFVQGLTFGTPGTGLKKKELRRIPVAVYGRGANIPPAATDCPICIGEFAEGEMVRVLPKCGHGFHARCIDTWLASHPSCPTCRHSLLDRGGGRGGGNGMTSPVVTDGVGVPVLG